MNISSGVSFGGTSTAQFDSFTGTITIPTAGMWTFGVRSDDAGGVELYDVAADPEKVAFTADSRFLWAIHVVHHSSERYNLSTALRQPVADVLGTGDTKSSVPMTALSADAAE